MAESRAGVEPTDGPSRRLASRGHANHGLATWPRPKRSPGSTPPA